MAPTTQRHVQSKILTRSASTSHANYEETVKQFREARKARENERLLKLRDCRLKNSTITAFNNATMLSSTTSSSRATLQNSKLPRNPSLKTAPLSVSLPPRQDLPKAGCQKRALIQSSTSSKIQGRSANFEPVTSSDSQQRFAVIESSTFSKDQAQLPVKSRRLCDRKSIFKYNGGNRMTKGHKPTRKIPKAEVKLTKTTQLRMLKSDPLLELSQFHKSSSKHLVLPLPTTFLRNHVDGNEEAATSKDVIDGSEPRSSKNFKTTHECHDEMLSKKVCFKSPGRKEHMSAWGESDQQSPSRIPVRKTSFLTPTSKPSATPKPSPLRKRLSEWLEKRNSSLDSFKHLKCFGLLGPLVKRPQTPFRKTALSTSSLKVIPENTEASPNKEDLDSENSDGSDGLNTTFTLEDEDKENIFSLDEEVKLEALQHTIPQSEQDQHIKELDEASGVLSELLKIIRMGYPTEQCASWLRAIRRRFPQCGDEAVYWECLASQDESRGDLSSAAACYEHAIRRGAEPSVQKSLDELRRKMSALHIEPTGDVSINNTPKPLEKSLLNSNIIKSSSIQFKVQEMSSSKKNQKLNDTSESVFCATPVRRSLRLACTPKKETPGVTCVRSLEFLEPEVRSSLVFHGNSALEPKD